MADRSLWAIFLIDIPVMALTEGFIRMWVWIFKMTGVDHASRK